MFEGLLGLSGFIVGLLVGITGVGGGALMTPLLILGFNISPVVAVGTDLIFAAITKSIGTVTHSYQNTVQWNIVILLAIGSIPTALITINILSDLQQSIFLDSLIQYALSVALFLTAFILFFKNKILTYIYPASVQSQINEVNYLSQTQCRLLTIGAGAVLGVLVTLTSIGAGALGVAVLTILYPRLKTAKVVGTDIAHAVPLTAIAGFGHFQLGNVDTQLLFILLTGSIPGVYVGSKLSQYLPEKYVRYILASILFGVGIKLIA